MLRKTGGVAAVMSPLTRLHTEGEIIAFRSTMTGTNLGPFQGRPPTGKPISVAHMHFVRMIDGKATDLWHVWDVAGLMRQLGAPVPQLQTA